MKRIESLKKYLMGRVKTLRGLIRTIIFALAVLVGFEVYAITGNTACAIIEVSFKKIYGTNSDFVWDYCTYTRNTKIPGAHLYLVALSVFTYDMDTIMDVASDIANAFGYIDSKVPTRTSHVHVLIKQPSQFFVIPFRMSVIRSCRRTYKTSDRRILCIKNKAVDYELLRRALDSVKSWSE